MDGDLETSSSDVNGENDTFVSSRSNLWAWMNILANILLFGVPIILVGVQRVEVPVSLFIGFVLAGYLFLAWWVVFGREGSISRALVGIGVVSGFIIASNVLPYDFVVVRGSILFAVAVFVLPIVRRLVSRVKGLNSTKCLAQTQFRIRDLLGWMAVLGMCLALLWTIEVAPGEVFDALLVDLPIVGIPTLLSSRGMLGGLVHLSWGVAGIGFVMALESLFVSQANIVLGMNCGVIIASAFTILPLRILHECT